MLKPPLSRSASKIGKLISRRCVHSIQQSSPFFRLVMGLKDLGQTCTVIESSCGGLINAGIMSIPGSSSVYYGGSVAYNTKRAKKVMLNDDDLHRRVIEYHSPKGEEPFSEANDYVQSKMHWTAETAKAFCEQMNVDYAIAEGGASGPTFRPKDLTKGFAVVAIAGRNSETGKANILAQTVVRSTHANRQKNMRLFADSAAEFAVETILDNLDTKATSFARSVTGVWLDRATHLRSDSEALRNLEDRLQAKCVVLLNSSQSLMQTFNGGVRHRLVLVPLHLLPSDIPRTFLGLNPQQYPIFGVDLQQKQLDEIKISLKTPEGAGFETTRTHAPLLPAHENELVLYATSLSQWKRTHKFCSLCGNTLVPIQGGTCLKCTSCSNESWPRQDPSIIVLVTNRDGNKALLARSPRHGPKLHTALAGFVEAGETFEQAIMRETFEETGIRVDPDSISYLSSQPWPFPRSCMIAFRATADDKSQEIVIDPKEIVSAHWFDKTQVQQAAFVRGAVMSTAIAAQAVENDPSLSVLIPPKGVVARMLIDDWLQDA